MNKKDFDWFSLIVMTLCTIALFLLIFLNGCAFYKTPIGTVVTCFKNIEIKDALIISDPNGPTIVLIGDYAGDSDGEEAGKFTGTVIKTLMGI